MNNLIYPFNAIDTNIDSGYDGAYAASFDIFSNNQAQVVELTIEQLNDLYERQN